MCGDKTENNDNDDDDVKDDDDGVDYKVFFFFYGAIKGEGPSDMCGSSYERAPSTPMIMVMTALVINTLRR